jgi:hypothetical protein
MLWDVRALAQTPIIVRWNARSLVTPDVDLIWGVLQSVSGQRTVRWTTLESATTNAQLLWSLRLLVSQSSTVRWLTNALTDRLIVFRWRISPVGYIEPLEPLVVVINSPDATSGIIVMERTIASIGSSDKTLATIVRNT